MNINTQQKILFAKELSDLVTKKIKEYENDQELREKEQIQEIKEILYTNLELQKPKYDVLYKGIIYDKNIIFLEKLGYGVKNNAGLVGFPSHLLPSFTISFYSE